MSIWRDQLERLETEGAPDDDHKCETDLALIAESEGHSEQSKCREMFELDASKDRTLLDGRHRRVGDIGKAKPVRQLAQFLTTDFEQKSSHL